MTPQERHLWYDFLKSYPVRFRRQHVIGSYVVDFYCSKARIVIELDGSQHFEPEEQKKDAERTAFLEGYGLQIVRIPNNEIKYDTEALSLVSIDFLNFTNLLIR